MLGLFLWWPVIEKQELGGETDELTWMGAAREEEGEERKRTIDHLCSFILSRGWHHPRSFTPTCGLGLYIVNLWPPFMSLTKLGHRAHTPDKESSQSWVIFKPHILLTCMLARAMNVHVLCSLLYTMCTNLLLIGELFQLLQFPFGLLCARITTPGVFG